MEWPLLPEEQRTSPRDIFDTTFEPSNSPHFSNPPSHLTGNVLFPPFLFMLFSHVRGRLSMHILVWGEPPTQAASGISDLK